MSGWVIDYDHEEHDPATNKLRTEHKVLYPTGGRSEAESTAQNLKKNKRVSNVVCKEVESNE